MGGSDKNGLPTDPVHVDTSSSLQVIEVDVAIFGDEKDYILLGTDLGVQKEKSGYKVYMINKKIIIKMPFSKTRNPKLMKYCQIPV